MKNCYGAAATFLAGSVILVGSVIGAFGTETQSRARQGISPLEQTHLVARGRYLTTIGVCSACHTPPNVSVTPSEDPAQVSKERTFKTDPDWFKYLDPEQKNFLAGGVPFILRLGRNLSGIVYTTNITPDPSDGIGTWTEQEIADTIREGRRPKKAVTADRPEYLYLFPPHSFYHNLAREDALAIAYFLKSIPAKKNPSPIPRRQLPTGFEPSSDTNPFGPLSQHDQAPRGRSLERAQYLTSSLVGCRECHSHHSNDPTLVTFAPDHENRLSIFRQGAAAIREYKRSHEWDPAEPFLGPLIAFAGGGSGDPYEGAFRLGPDLPLRLDEKGVSLFPYPGYAVLYGPNLTEFGLNGPQSAVSVELLVRAIRQGISPEPDDYGRPKVLSQVMMWPFYAAMSDEDAYSIAEFIKSLTYIPNNVNLLTYYGDNWEGMFTQVFGEPPDDHDREIFGKKRSP